MNTIEFKLPGETIKKEFAAPAAQVQFLLKLFPEIEALSAPANEFTMFTAAASNGRRVYMSGRQELINFCLSKYQMKINGTEQPVYEKYWDGRKILVGKKNLYSPRPAYEVPRPAMWLALTKKRLTLLEQNYACITKKLTETYQILTQHLPPPADPLINKLYQQNKAALAQVKYLPAAGPVDLRRAHKGLKALYRLTVNINTMVTLINRELNPAEPEFVPRDPYLASYANFANYDDSAAGYKRFLQNFSENINFELAALAAAVPKLWPALFQEKARRPPANAKKKYLRYEQLAQRPTVPVAVRVEHTENRIFRQMLSSLKGFNRVITGQHEFVLRRINTAAAKKPPARAD